MIQSCLYARPADRYDWCCERIPRLKSGLSRDSFNIVITKGYRQLANKMKEEIIKDALQIQEERASEQAREALNEEGTMLDILLKEQKKAESEMNSATETYSFWLKFASITK